MVFSCKRRTSNIPKEVERLASVVDGTSKCLSGSNEGRKRMFFMRSQVEEKCSEEEDRGCKRFELGYPAKGF